MGKLFSKKYVDKWHTGKVKGSQFKFSADVYASGAEVKAPFDGKIAHVYQDKTKCDGATLSSQFTLRETYINAKGDRHFTGKAIALAHITTEQVPRHVTEGQSLGYVTGSFLHVSSKAAETLLEVL